MKKKLLGEIALTCPRVSLISAHLYVKTIVHNISSEFDFTQLLSDVVTIFDRSIKMNGSD
jgi:hypothetical protein